VLVILIVTLELLRCNILANRSYVDSAPLSVNLQQALENFARLFQKYESQDLVIRPAGGVDSAA